MTHQELSEFCDGFMDNARRHEACAKLVTTMDVRLFHDMLARHYRAMADETNDLRGIARNIDITARRA